MRPLPLQSDKHTSNKIHYLTVSNIGVKSTVGSKETSQFCLTSLCIGGINDLFEFDLFSLCECFDGYK